MSRLDFRIDWGYQYLYSRRHYHPVYLWDGALECEGGRILESRRLEYPVLWFGPGQSARETPMEEPRWKSRTRRGLSGVRFIVEVERDDATFRLKTLSGEFTFSAAEIREQGRIVFPVGPKYLGCHVIVTRTGYLWFRPAPRPGEQVWEADDLPLPQHDWARMRTAWLAPGETVEFEAEIPPTKGDFSESVLHLVAMAAPGYTPGREKQIHDHFPMRLFCDGNEAAQFGHNFREFDRCMQMLEDVWVRFQVSSGKHRFGIRNENPHYWLLLSRVTLRQSSYRHLELSLPRWALAGEPLTGRIFAARPERTEVRWPGGAAKLDLVPGWNEFSFSLSSPARNVVVETDRSSGIIPAVYGLAEENPPVTVGYDMSVVPHDNQGFMDWLLDYTWRTQLGNLVVFRALQWQTATGFEPRPVEPALLARWGEFCRSHHITVEAANNFEDGTLVKAAGPAMHSAGLHEYPGVVYACDPEPPWSSEDMKEAAEHYLAYLRKEVARTHRSVPRAAFGDASGGHRYCYLAGVDFIRTETMVSHTQHLCSQARPAAEALGSGEWGVHIAVQHALQPYFETHLGIYFLSLFQPWMMGASMIYEEDSLFLLLKEERQSWDDCLTRGKREMTRRFYRFVKTHPRTGRNRRNIAFLEGRYAAPFNGFICGSEQTPAYSVWGLFGNSDPVWGHGQPEKCRQILDVLMPGASTQPLRQRYDRRRFFFSGTPYGDFDEVPVEADGSYLQQYQLLLNLGWNTMIEEDFRKLYEFVSEGGTLFTGLPQFSTHVRRDFLRDWRDLALWNNGDLSELCGVRILGPGERYSGQWNCAGRETFPDVELSAVPSESSAEDGPCRLARTELAGAEIVAWDAASGEALIVRNRVGNGAVYLLTAWAYPGHEELQSLAASWVAHLAGEHRGTIYVDDPSREVFWSRWEEANGCSRLMLLNTDWSCSNEKTIQVHTPWYSFETVVKEQVPLLLTLLPLAALEPDPEMHVEILAVNGESARLRFHCSTPSAVTIHWRDGRREIRSVDPGESTVRKVTLEAGIHNVG